MLALLHPSRQKTWFRGYVPRLAHDLSKLMTWMGITHHQSLMNIHAMIAAAYCDKLMQISQQGWEKHRKLEIRACPKNLLEHVGVYYPMAL